MNPEVLLNEVALAIAHRCISTTERWHLIYYHNRICCAPSYEGVPPEIILISFTEEMAQGGFKTGQWNLLKTRIAKLCKELNP